MAVIWIINQYALQPAERTTARHNFFANRLSELGHGVTIICAREHHLQTKSPSSFIPNDHGFKIRIFNTFRYAHARDKRRVLAWFVFAWRLLSLKKTAEQNPDIILISSPSLISFLGAESLAKHFGARLVLEIRDLWPLSLIDLGQHSAKHPFIKFLAWLEARAIGRSDHVVTTMEGGTEYVSTIGDGQTPCTWIPNALSKKTIEKFRLEAIKVRAEDERFVVGYTGTLGFTNSVVTIVQAASLLRQDTTIKFVILGKGPQEVGLKQSVTDNELSNVEFLPHGTEDVVIATLRKVDATLICWRDRSIYNFGTSAMKVPTYLAIGKPIIQAYSGKYDRIKMNDAGITVPAENARALADAVMQMKNKTTYERNRLGENGHALAHNIYSLEIQFPKLLKAFGLVK